MLRSFRRPIGQHGYIFTGSVRVFNSPCCSIVENLVLLPSVLFPSLSQNNTLHFLVKDFQMLPLRPSSNNSYRLASAVSRVTWKERVNFCGPLWGLIRSPWVFFVALKKIFISEATWPLVVEFLQPMFLIAVTFHEKNFIIIRKILLLLLLQTLPESLRDEKIRPRISERK